MLKKALLLVFSFLWALSVFAQAVDLPEEIEAVVSAESIVATGSQLEFSAEHSFNPFPEKPVFYRWNFGDGSQRGTGQKISHIFAEPGTYEVTLQMTVGNQTDEISLSVFAHEKLIFALTDSEAGLTQLEAVSQAAREKNIYLLPVLADNSRGFLTAEGSLLSALQANRESVLSADPIILQTTGSDGLNALTRFLRDDVEFENSTQKDIVVITESALDPLARISRSTFVSLEPRQILLTRTDALRELVLSGVSDETQSALENQAISFRVVDSDTGQFRFFNFLDFIVNYLIAHGVPASVVLLVLLLPVIATLVAFFKQVIGLTTFGVYTPSVITLSFLAVGLKLGLSVLIVVVVSSVAMRVFLKKYRLAYAPRVALVMTMVALAMLLTMAVVTAMFESGGGESTLAEMLTAAIFPMLVVSTLAEKFISIQAEKGMRMSLQMLVEVVLVSVVCYFIVGQWEFLRTALLARPEWIFAFLAFDVLLGRFTGLRLTEYFRFRDVLKKAEEEEEE